MRVKTMVAVAVVVQLLLASAAVAAPVKMRHGSVNDRFTTTRPGAASGFNYDGVYHAAGDPTGAPPYMRRMTFYPARGQRYDTTAAPQCTASDAELAIRGAAACPAGSRLGGGKVVGRFMDQFPNELEADFFNAPGEQIILARSPVFASVSRGRIAKDQTVTYEAPTCYPWLLPAPCPVDNALQVESHMRTPRYVRNGRAYMRTPPRCPASGHWTARIRFWWKDGTTDLVVTKKPCAG
ncbi:MAG TPA: hypothetical protein VJT75_14390 [Thermoleophilaceae bacterium]|nr:hypothetical protein [Thermoleophilaceae bacterium]